MMFEQFKQRAETAHAEVHRFFTKTEALDFLADLLRHEAPADGTSPAALIAPCPLLTPADRERLAALPGVSLAVTRERAAAATFGVSQMDWALADTGTLVQDATDIALRLVSTLPAVHVALVTTDALVPDLPALLPRLSPAKSRHLAFITGPSRTADIERVLTIGVHGPKRLITLFIDADGITA